MNEKPTSKSLFGTAQKVFDITKAMQDIEDQRALDRAKINVLFNGGKPYSPEDEKKYQIQINVNWGMGQRIMQDANRQLNNALLHPGTLFTCTYEAGQVDKRDEISAVVTSEIHKPLQRDESGRQHTSIIKQRNATIAMHGIGAILWQNPARWMGRFVGLEDLLIPTDTYCDGSNQNHFAVNLYVTPGEFIAMTQGDAVHKGWNKSQVRKILDGAMAMKQESTPSTWRDQPEAMLEVFKQNKGYYYTDAIPKIRLRAFYYQDVSGPGEAPGKWYRKIILRETAGIGDAKIDEFVYDSNEPFADKLSHILNIQYGDSSLVAPFKYHSVRGLGVPLFAPVETLNRLQCEFVQHVFEQLKMYFRATDPADRDRLKQVVLSAYGFIPEGLTIVPREQRHQIDGNLVQAALSQMRQFTQENSSSYVQDVEQSSGSPITAKEATIRLNQANQMVGGMLQAVYLQENYYYQEVFRRFCSDMNDPDVKEFKSRCMRRGVPKEAFDPKKWSVQAERVLGAGDLSIGQMQAQWLMDQRPKFNPQAQNTILRLATNTVLNDPSKAEMLVPKEPVYATSGTYAAENVFGTLMQGIECAPRKGIDEIGYIEALLEMMQAVIVKIQGTDNIGSIDDIIGLQNVAKNIGQHLAVLQQNDEEKQRVKQYADALGKMMNEVKGFAQRYMEQKQKEAEEAQRDPEGEAKAQTTIMLAQKKAEIDQMNAQSKMRIDQMNFQMDQARQQAESMAEAQREEARFKQEIFQESMAAATKLMIEERSMNMKMEALRKTTEAKIKQIEAQARAQKQNGNGDSHAE